MKQIQCRQTGVPAEVIECVEVADPVLSAPDEVRVAVELFPINPADLLTMQGYYPRGNPNAPTLGIEALGVVEAAGPAVTNFAAGDRVIFLTTDNWSERKVVKERDLVRVSSAIDAKRLASLKVNPATAALLLTQFAALQPGDWFLQNAATSAVGRAAIQIARSRGIRTANIVRRPDVTAELENLGADAVLLDGDDLAARLAKATGNAPIRLAADAVAGAATNRLASCLSEKGTLVIYGAMSGEAAMIDPGLAVFQDIMVRGFWLTRHLATAPRPDILALYAELERLIEQDQLTAAVDSVFAAEDIRDAVRRAGEPGVNGKVLVKF